MKYLFGTMDNGDMRNLNSLIDHVQGYGEKLFHTVEQQVTYIKQLNSRVHENTKNIITMATKLKKEMVETVNEMTMR